MAKINDIDMTHWRDSGVNVESLWIIKERDKSGKHANVYHGNFVPQIPQQLIKRYTKKGDVVLDMFMGSGTTLFEAETQERNFIGFDINKIIIDYVNSKMDDDTSKIKYFIHECDILDTDKVKNNIQNDLMTFDRQQVDLIISHPPYMDIVKFTDLDVDLSHIGNLNEFIEKFIVGVKNVFPFLKKDGFFSVVIGDLYKNQEVLPLGFYLMYAIKKNFNVKLKGIIVKNIEGNRGKLGANDIWHYRALNSDYFIFKHEYIFIFKKN
ncbi:MAG: DNA adenine methylase [Paludibacteraceae bacterium]|nr:DNA adenine methylase [Paludibacteraceae bacterium]